MTKYVIGKMTVLKRQNIDGSGGTIIQYIEDTRYGIFDSIKIAKASFMRMYDLDLSGYSIEKDLDFLVKHFDAMSRNLKYYKVLRKVV